MCIGIGRARLTQLKQATTYTQLMSKSKEFQCHASDRTVAHSTICLKLSSKASTSVSKRLLSSSSVNTTDIVEGSNSSLAVSTCRNRNNKTNGDRWYEHTNYITKMACTKNPQAEIVEVHWVEAITSAA